MAIIDLNFTVDYCRRWSMWQAVREVVANARDVEAQGGSFEVSHDAKKRVLTVTSHGQSMGSRALVFGATAKGADDRTIGQFGDGLKVAFGVFLRHGCEVRVDTGREVWVPREVERDGERCVAVSTRALPAQRHRDRVVFEVGGVDAADWAEWRRRFLFLSPPAKGDRVSARGGAILRGAEHRGAIFCKGVLVRREDDLRYGYEMDNLSLNRDRDAADPWEIGSSARAMWLDAAAADQRAAADLYALLSDHEQEDVSVGQTAWIDRSDAEAVARAFTAEHGDAVPVVNSAEAEQAGHLGLKSAIVPASLRNVLGAAGIKGLRDREQAVREDVLAEVAEADLAPRELDALQGALAVLAPAVADRGEVMPVVTVVEFRSPSRLGLYRPASDTVLIARRCLSSHTLHGVLAHEIAHRQGGDGDAAHREAIEDIMGRALAHLLRGAA